MNALPFALSLIRSHWKMAVFAGVALMLAIQTFRLSATEAALGVEKAGRALDRSAYEKAQAEATALALSNKLKAEAEYARQANEADTRATDLSDQYRAAVLRYEAAQRASRATDLPKRANAPQGADGPGGGAVIPQGSILIPTGDALICGENTARLQSAHDWSGMIAGPVR